MVAMLPEKKLRGFGDGGCTLRILPQPKLD